MTAPGSADQVALVGIPQIARIASVGPSAVGNWRKRYADFPTPKVQAPSGALFDLDEIERWLVESGKLVARVPWSVRLWALADSARGDWRPEQFASFCVAALVYFEACEQAETGSGSAVVPEKASWTRVREVEGSEEFVRCLQWAADQLEALNPDLAGLLTPVFSRLRPEDGQTARRVAIALDEASDDMTMRSELLDEVAATRRLVPQTRRGRLLGDTLENLIEADRFAAAYSTPDDICYLVSQLVATAGGVIFDPAVGEGGLLLLAALWQYNATQPPTLVGIEINEAVERITRARCYLYGIPADIQLGNALTADLAQIPKADSVVLDPPYGVNAWGNAEVYLDPRWRFGSPPPGNADFAWLQVAVLQLKANGRAGVVLPAGALSRAGREAAIRQAMIEAGVVEGVVLLPPRLRANTSIQLAVWLLRSPDSAEPSNELLLVDASGLGKPGRSRFTLEEDVIDQLGSLVQTWREWRVIEPDNAGIAMAIPVTALTEADLDPKRYRKPSHVSIEAMEDRVQELRRTVSDDAQQVQHTLTNLIEHLGGLP